jgi:uncharacterized protein (DUF2141 family)
MKLHIAIVTAALAAALVPPPAAAQGVLGSDAAACTSGQGPAIRVTVTGLKDRKGDLKLELYPANEEDFLKDDGILIREGKVFRRIETPIPATGNPVLCIRVPRAGRYALLFTHNRDGRNKFNFWSDGAGFASNSRIGRARPKVEAATIDVGGGVTPVTVRAQYLRGLGGFGPVGD